MKEKFIASRKYLHIKREQTEKTHFFVCDDRFQNRRKSIPLCQMLSEVQYTEEYSEFLKELAKGKRVPNECVSDDSAAILGAVIAVFNALDSTNTYIQQCLQLLEGNCDSAPT